MEDREKMERTKRGVGQKEGGRKEEREKEKKDKREI